MEYELTVGLEVHAELKTENKIFCNCKNTFGKEPNSVCCPVCTGMPGTLPKLNREVVKLAIQAGSALNCKLNKISCFDRKNYFYPDLPKGYQITQKRVPILTDGYLIIEGEKINIERIHIEEDAGKLTYDEEGNYLPDYNRCGIPLIEIVSKPDIHSAKTAVEYLKKLRLYLIYSGVSDCKMQEGSFRCDVNVSVKPKGTDITTERTEIKNASSFKFIERAINYEYERQISLIEQGIPIKRMTLKIDEETGKTIPMREKESSEDYRYFPEPDLKDLILTDDEIYYFNNFEFLNPDRLIKKYTEDIKLPYKNAIDILNKPVFLRLFEETIPLTANPQGAANIITSELFKNNEASLLPSQLAELSDLVYKEKISSATAKKIISYIKHTKLSANDVAKERNLFQINNTDIITELVLSAIKNNPKACEDYKNGKKSSIGPILGEINRKTGGLVNQRLAVKILEDNINV